MGHTKQIISLWELRWLGASVAHVCLVCSALSTLYFFVHFPFLQWERLLWLAVQCMGRETKVLVQEISWSGTSHDFSCLLWFLLNVFILPLTNRPTTQNARIISIYWSAIAFKGQKTVLFIFSLLSAYCQSTATFRCRELLSPMCTNWNSADINELT